MKAMIAVCLLPLGLMFTCAGCQTAQPGQVRQNGSQADAQLAAAQSEEIIRDIKKNTDQIVFQPEDKIAIQVWLKDKVTQLSGYPLELKIAESGEIFLPHVGLVTLAGKSVPAVRSELQAALSKTLNEVTVIVARKAEREIGGREGKSAVEIGRHYIIMGFINRPGVYPLEHNLRVREAVAIAGGLAKFARANIYLVRGDREKPEVMRVNMNDIFFGDSLAGNVVLKPNDAIYVSSKSLYQIADFVQLLLSPITSVRDTLWVYDRLVYNRE